MKRTRTGKPMPEGWSPPQNHFKQEYCELLIENGKRGGSIAQFCASLSLSRNTFNTWVAANENFREAKAIAQEACKSYWDNKVDKYSVESYEGDRLNTSHLKYIASERFPARQRIKLRNPGNLQMCAEDVWAAVSSGELSVDDANKFGLLLKTSAEIEVHTKLVEDVEELKKIVAQNKSEGLGSTESGPTERDDH